MQSDTVSSATDSRLRSLARRKGYRLCRARGQLHSNNLGGYQIVDPFYNLVVDGANYDLAADYVEEWLKDAEPGMLVQ